MRQPINFILFALVLGRRGWQRRRAGSARNSAAVGGEAGALVATQEALATPALSILTVSR